MTIWQAILLGVLQGLTEFLPVSSSGHLVIVPHLLGWPDPGLALDTMLHLGTLLAIVVFFWGDIWRLVRAALVSLQRRSLADPDSRVAWSLVVATIPGALLGFFFEDFFERLFGMPRAAAAFLLVTALVLVVSEVVGKRFRPIAALSWIDALAIGLAQSLAIAPGISRSGSTIAAGMLLGFHREEAARFSFLLAIPITLGSGAFQLLKLIGGTSAPAAPAVVLSGMVAAAVAGYLAIAALLALLRRQNLLVFAVYCAALGLAVLTGLLG